MWITNGGVASWLVGFSCSNWVVVF
jgi:hypothetical protein